MALLAANALWNLQFRMVCTPGIGQRTNAALLGTRFGDWLSANTHGVVTMAEGGGNVHARTSDRAVLGTSDATVELSAVVRGTANWNTAAACLAFANAVKDAGNPGFSAQRIADKFPADANGCGAVDNFGMVTSLFGDGEYVTRVCLSYAPAASGAAPPPSGGFTDRAIATVGTGAVRDSTRPSEVGQRTPGLAPVIPQLGNELWESIPLGYKIGGGFVLGMVGLVALAYVVRSFK